MACALHHFSKARPTKRPSNNKHLDYTGTSETDVGDSHNTFRVEDLEMIIFGAERIHASIHESGYGEYLRVTSDSRPA